MSQVETVGEDIDAAIDALPAELLAAFAELRVALELKPWQLGPALRGDEPGRFPDRVVRSRRSGVGALRRAGPRPGRGDLAGHGLPRPRRVARGASTANTLYPRARLTYLCRYTAWWRVAGRRRSTTVGPRSSPSRPRLVLLHGLPSSGKSTLAYRSIDDHPQALCLDVDLVRGLPGRWSQQPAQAGQTASR